MTLREGKVKAIKDWGNNKYNLFIDVGNNDGEWYSFFGKPTVKKGDVISFEYSSNEKNGKVFLNGDVDTLKVISSAVFVPPQSEVKQQKTDVEYMKGVRFGNVLNATSNYSKDVDDNIRNARDLYNKLCALGIYGDTKPIDLILEEKLQ